MKKHPSTAGPIKPIAERPSWRWVWGCVALIIVVGVGAYHNSFAGPFIFDDEGSIVENSTIRRLWPVGPMLHPPAQGQAVQRRPVANVSLAINYAISGLKVWSYHAMNLLLHVLAALVLLGVVRRTLESPRLQSRFGGQALALATAIAVIWVLHPLQTDAVTYVIQRTEVLAGLFYLLTLHAVIRGASSPTPYRWYAGAVAGCLLAMGSKESAVSAPLVVLVYDRIFLGGSWREVWRRRWGLYTALAATWVIVLVMIPHGQEGSRIFGDSQDRTQYALAQGEAIVRYLALCFWPTPLVVDYGFCPPQDVWRSLPYLATVAVLLAGTVLAFWWRAELAFLGVWFFAILAPSSSIVPLRQVAGEKRMYLPLAAVVTLVVMGGWALWTVLAARLARPRPRRWPHALPVAVVALVAVALGLRTLNRNEDYRTSEAIWQSVLASMPEIPRAQNNLGSVLVSQGRFEEAIAHCQKALRLEPNCADPHNNWGNALQGLGQFEEAVVQYREAVRIQPDYAKGHNNWGNALEALGRLDEAAKHYQEAVRIQPDYAEAHYNWGNVLAAQERFNEAVSHYQEAVRIKPDHVQAHNNWGGILQGLGRFEEAVSHYQQALRIKPDYAEAHNNWGNTLTAQGRFNEAISHYQEALRIQPDYAEAHDNWGIALHGQELFEEALSHYQQALRIKPDYARAHANSGGALQRLGRLEEAVGHCQQAVRIKPDCTEAYNNWGIALAKMGQFEEAAEHFRHALRIKPDFTSASENLRRAEAILQQNGSTTKP